MNSDFERRIFDELPHEVQDKLYTGFLFVSFLSNFRLFFKLKSIKGNSFTWHNQNYRDFMMQILMNLEPRYEE